ncbi:MAG: hypothetical protein ABSC48_07470 [Terracidiphilus sp.]|jgi:hypothetical protein
MIRISAIVTTLILSVILFASAAAAQERSQGISVHMLPKRVADTGGMAWGFTVDYSPRLKAESPWPVLQTVEAVLSFIRKQDTGVRKNGLWIVTTHPDAYSEAEKALLESVKSMCRQEGIPLFICRASELPNGWVRFDQ